MLESLTIYSKGGLILYQYRSDPSLVKAEDSASRTRSAINSIQQGRVAVNASSVEAAGSAGGDFGTGFHIKDGLTFVWKESKADGPQPQWVVMALYPDILFEGPRAYLRSWAENLVQRTADEYELYFRVDRENRDHQRRRTPRPDPAGFDATFRSILHQSKTSKQDSSASAPPPSNPNVATVPSLSPVSGSSGSGKGGKEQRHWIGSGKVNDKALAELDRSNPDERVATADSEERRLQEARQQYLPTEQELRQRSTSQSSSSASSDPSASGWGSAMSSLWLSLTLNKNLTKEDLAQPLERMQQALMEKNVALSIAQKLCATVERELVGKKLNSLYRVQTAVRQGLEKAIYDVLESSLHVDLLRLVLTKKETAPGWFGMGSAGTKKRRPYVICVLGINGIGKTTTVAKLAYYFQTHGCRVLLVAGDTFRSGAVEQLKTHARCLECDIFAQGYAKDPASVATAALTHADQPAQPQYDVVLIDTAGRMQNNAPLMSALTKLVQTVPTDCTLLVAEALVGHDALSQYEMFHRAVRKIHGLILTKYDTVGTKVGAALTLTHETSTPIVFLGTGQKYHHLQTLNVNSVISSLFSA